MEDMLLTLQEFEQKKDILELFGIMKKGINLSVDIIENLNSYSTNDFNIQKVNIEKAVHTVISILKARIPSALKIEIDVPKGMTVDGSQAGLNQLLMNLIKNSIDAVGGTGTIKVVARVEQDGWALEVSDTGSGIAKDTIGKIFDPFFSTKGVGKGTGLGLFVVHSEVKRHGGHIDVTSEVGKWTKFLIKFPAIIGKESRTS